MKLKDTFMSSPICVKILKHQCLPKNFLLLCRQFFSIHNLEVDNFFRQLQLANNFFYKKGNPPIKNNGPSLTEGGLSNKGRYGCEGLGIRYFRGQFLPRH